VTVRSSRSDAVGALEANRSHADARWRAGGGAVGPKLSIHASVRTDCCIVLSVKTGYGVAGVIAKRRHRSERCGCSAQGRRLESLGRTRYACACLPWETRRSILLTSCKAVCKIASWSPYIAEVSAVSQTHR
jgi:hypothetical protein